MKKDDHDQMLEKMDRLDDQVKEVLILRLYGELSFKEIGLLVGKSENYARVTFHRGKRKLQKELEGEHG